MKYCVKVYPHYFRKTIGEEHTILRTDDLHEAKMFIAKIFNLDVSTGFTPYWKIGDIDYGTIETYFNIHEYSQLLRTVEIIEETT